MFGDGAAVPEPFPSCRSSKDCTGTDQVSFCHMKTWFWRHFTQRVARDGQKYIHPRLAVLWPLVWGYE